ncbi:hypothetical protein GBAR_LOCUS14585 [Geodia barretti]|uniref:Uncharacterized protein n=1 Tax=Geodia barretti TaxID=519541 RepID=A0AA35WQ97_GEOBA|nr:hypothetical protein GBAR_LOCUS14585 [Geodia barretti]
MIKTRLKRMEPCTWRDLYDALKHPTVDMPSVANKLAVKLPIGTNLPAFFLIKLLHSLCSCGTTSRAKCSRGS